MPRAINQSMAWVIATIMSILIFSGVLALFGASKPKAKELAEHSSVGHEHGETSEGHQHSSHEDAPATSEKHHGEENTSHVEKSSPHASEEAKGEEKEISADQFKSEDHSTHSGH